MPGPFKVSPAGGGGTVQPVTPPAPASESVAAGGSLADVTFGAFTDPGGRIDNYALTKTNVVGTANASGSGLGPYAITGDADEEVLLLELDARDASNNVLATASYTGTIGKADPAAVTPPSAASEAVAAGGSLADVTFGSFTDPDGRIDNYNLVTTNVSGSATASGSGLGPYAISGDADGEVLGLELQARDSSNNVLATAVYVGRIASESIGEWEDISSYLFNTNITDLTLTKAAAAATLYESDGTTPIIDLRFLNRSNTPVSTAAVTAALGKLLLTNESNGGTEASYVWGEMTESDMGVDWSSGKLYALDFVLSGLTWGSDGDDCWLAFGTSASGISAGNNVGIRFRRTSSSDYNQNGRRYFGSAVNGAKQNSQASAPTSAVVRMLIYRGVLVDVYWQMNTTTRLTGWPTPSASVFRSDMGTDALTTEGTIEKFGASSYFFIDAQATSGNPGTIGLEAIYVQEFK